MKRFFRNILLTSPKIMAVIVFVFGLLIFFYSATGITNLLKKETQLLINMGSSQDLLRQFNLSKMNQQLEEINGKLAEEQKFFPDDIKNSDIAEQVLKLSSASGIEITDLSIKPAKSQKIASGNYISIPVTLIASSDEPHFRIFLDNLEKKFIKTAIIEKVNTDFQKIEGNISIDLNIFLKAPAESR